VIEINDGPPCWHVFADPSERVDEWANPMLVGVHPLEVELEEESG